MASQRDLSHHREAMMTVNLLPTVKELCKHFLRVIEEVKPLFLEGGRLSRAVQKRWYGKQLVDAATGFSFGYIWFTVTNRAVMDNSFDIDDEHSRVKDLEFSFHVKQIETTGLAANFTSGSLRYKLSNGEFDVDKTTFMLYGGCDIESALQFRNLVEKVIPQLTAFHADDNTFVSQNEVYKVGIHLRNS